MTLQELLDESDHEVWFKIECPGKDPILLWSADYLGWYEPLMKEIGMEGLLEKEIGGDGYYLDVIPHPEEDDDNLRVPVICVPLALED